MSKVKFNKLIHNLSGRVGNLILGSGNSPTERHGMSQKSAQISARRPVVEQDSLSRNYSDERTDDSRQDAKNAKILQDRRSCSMSLNGERRVPNRMVNPFLGELCVFCVSHM
jgi:hypothetical protein